VTDRPSPTPRTLKELLEECRQKFGTGQAVPLPPPAAPPPPPSHHDREPGDET
jgi:hypothetical protein